MNTKMAEHVTSSQQNCVRLFTEQGNVGILSQNECIAQASLSNIVTYGYMNNACSEKR